MVVTKSRLTHLCARACHNVPLTTLLPALATLRQIGKCPAGPAKPSQRPTLPHRLAASGRSAGSGRLAVSGRATVSEPPTVPGRPTAFGRPPMPQPNVVIPRPEGRGICSSSAHDPHASPVFNTLQTLFRARGPQPKQLHRLTHSWLFAKDITIAFPTSYQLPGRSAAPERNITAFFSSACTLFCKNTGGAPKIAEVKPENSPIASPGTFPGNANLRIGGLALPTRPPAIVAIFPATSALLRRSLAPERKSTPVFSIVCTLFCKNTGGRGVPPLN